MLAIRVIVHAILTLSFTCSPWVARAEVCDADAGVCGREEYVIVIGNPGVGKSTLLNSMFQRHLFDSGPSAGGGMTKLFQMEDVEFMNRTIHLIDSPGLADADTRDKCAQEIEKGLKKGGLYRILIMVRQQHGRVIVEDKTAMKLILDALPTVSNNEFGILVNQVPRKMMKQFGEKAFKAKFINSLLSGLVRETKHIRMIEYDEDLDAEHNQWLAADSVGLAQATLLLKEVHPVVIETHDVEKVHAQEFDKEKAEMEKRLKQLEIDRAHAAKMEEQNQHVIRALETKMEKSHQEVVQREAMFNRQLKEANDRTDRLIHKLEHTTSGK